MINNVRNACALRWQFHSIAALIVMVARRDAAHSGNNLSPLLIFGLIPISSINPLNNDRIVAASFSAVIDIRIYISNISNAIMWI